MLSTYSPRGTKGVQKCRECESRGITERRVPCGHCEESDLTSPPRPVQVTPRRVQRTTPQQHSPALFTRESALALLLVSCLLRSSGASPARHKSHWKNPCALPLAALSGESVLNLPPASDRQILDRIIHLNGMVAPKLDDHLRQFVLATYHTEPSAMLRDWGHHSLGWLRWVAEAISRREERLAASRLPLAEALRAHFGELQRLAVAFEQTTLDAALYGDPSLDGFRHMQADLMQLLCELHIGLLEKRLKPDSSAVQLAAHKHHQPETNRERSLRDWILLREYKLYIAHVDRVLRALRDQEPEE